MYVRVNVVCFFVIVFFSETNGKCVRTCSELGARHDLVPGVIHDGLYVLPVHRQEPAALHVAAHVERELTHLAGVKRPGQSLSGRV